MDLRILPECYVDTALIKSFGFVSPNHKLGNSVVLKTLEGKGYTNSIGIGIIDRDKKQPSLLTAYSHFNTRRSIEVRHKENTKRFIIIHPNIEKWTFDEGQRLGLNLRNYNLPTTFEAYKNFCKKNEIEDNPHIKNYFNALANLDSDIRILKEIINRLIESHS